MFGPKKDRPAGRPHRVQPQLVQLDARDVPAVVAVDDFYSVQAGQVITIPASRGVLANDFSTDGATPGNPDAILVVGKFSGPTTAKGGFPALPGNTLTLNSNGSFTFIAPSGFDTSFGPIVFTYQAVDVNNPAGLETSNTATVTINVTSGAGRFFAVAADAGAGPQVRVFNQSDGLERFSFFPYESTFTGGVRVAVGDLDQDGFDDIVTAPAGGGSARIVVFDGKTGLALDDFFAFEDTFRGGAYVAVGDADGDGTNDVIVGAGERGGPRVQVYSGKNFFGAVTPAPSADFFAYEESFRSGVRVAAGDLNNDGTDEVVTGAGPGGGPVVKVFDVFDTEITDPSGFPIPVAEQSFLAFEASARNGVNVAVGQFRGDGNGDIIAGNGGGSPLVRVFDGRSGAQLRQFTVPSGEIPTGGTFGPDPGTSTSGGFIRVGTGGGGGNFISTGGVNTGGVRVAAADRTGDGLDDIITGPGPGSQARVRFFDGNGLDEISNFLAFPTGFRGGVWVGGSSD